MAMQLAFACMLLVSLNGCLKDNYAHAYTLYQPIYMTLTEARAQMKSGAPQAIESPGKLRIAAEQAITETRHALLIILNSPPHR